MCRDDASAGRQLCRSHLTVSTHHLCVRRFRAPDASERSPSQSWDSRRFHGPASVVRRSRVTSVFPPRIFPRRLTIRLNHADRWMLESLAAGRGKMLLGRGTRNRGLCNFRCCQLVVRCGRSVLFGFVPGIPSSFALSCMLYCALFLLVLSFVQGIRVFLEYLMSGMYLNRG